MRLNFSYTILYRTVIGKEPKMLKILNKVKGLALLLFTLFTSNELGSTLLSEQDKKLLVVIEEATDYSLVKPQQALTILNANKHLLLNASKHYRYLYFKTGFWAAIYLYDSEKIFYYLEHMFNNREFAGNEQYWSELTYSFSLWYGINQQYDTAVLAGLCAIKFSDNDQAMRRSTVALGLTYLLTDSYAEAKQVFKINLTLSEKANNPRYISSASNNLGLLYIFTEQYELAEQYLRTALKLNESMARANGTALNLANLLMVFYLQRDWQSVNRLTNRAVRATKSLNNEDLKHYVFWINAAAKLQTKQTGSLETPALIERYQQVQDPTILKLIGLIAEQLKIKLPVITASSLGRHIDFAKHFPTCNSSSLNEVLAVE